MSSEEQMEAIYESVPEVVRNMLSSELPSEPGSYKDQQGESWTLSESGNWYDRHGTTFDPKYNFFLPMVGIKMSKSVH